MITPQKRVQYIAKDGSLTQEGILLLLSMQNDVSDVRASLEESMLQAYPFAAIGGQDTSATEYSLLVDLSDTDNFPHTDTGHAEFINTYLTVDREGTATGVVQVGVIARIDASTADIYYAQGFVFKKTDEKSIIRDRPFFPAVTSYELKPNGKPRYITSNFNEINTPNINTGITLTTAAETEVTPAVGDIIVKATHTSGATFDYSASGHYRTKASGQ